MKHGSIATPHISASAPNGEYDFGGGTAYATRSHRLGKRQAQRRMSAIRCPTRSPGFFLAARSSTPSRLRLRRSSGGAAHRSGRHQPRRLSASRSRTRGRSRPGLTLDYGVRWEVYTPIYRARAPHRRASASIDRQAAVSSSIRSPAIATDWNGLAAARPGHLAGDPASSAHTRAAASCDSAEYLAGQLPHRLDALRRLSRARFRRQRAPFTYGFQITPAQLPRRLHARRAGYLRQRNAQDRSAPTR